MLTLLLLLLGLAGAQAGWCAPAGPPQPDAHTLLLAHFDTSCNADLAKGSPAAEVKEAALVAQGRWGGAVKLDAGQWLSFDPQGNLDMKAGTLMCWIKPDWNPADGQSHALLSMGLDGDPAGYFVLSQGWWESSGGAGRMYFICDNQSYMHASTTQLLGLGERLNEWHHLVLTWAEGKPGHCALYLDGEPAARTTRICEHLRRPRTRLFIGSDAPTGMGSDRPAKVLLDELAIYDKAFTDEEVAAAFAAQEPNWAAIQARRNAWLTDVLKAPAPKLPRDGQGRLRESRAILDESWNWASREGADQIVARLKAAGFNVFVPCVWHGRGTHWPSPLEPPAPGVDKLMTPEHDPLAYLVKQCHANGIEVHPWFCVCSRSGNLHPEFREEGSPDGFFDAHRPEFRDWMVGLMLDVVRRYGVDGINLDYIRTGGICRGPKCQEEHRARTGASLTDDISAVGKSLEARGRLVQWQDEAIADLVRQLATEGRKLKPGLVVSADVHVAPPAELPALDGRNVLPWIEQGWLDVAYSMDYGRTLAYARLDASRAATRKPAAVVELCGNYEVNNQGKVVPREGQLVADLLSYCQRKWPGNGVGLYIYSMLDDAQAAALRAGPFKEDAVPSWVR
ncbi:family 10 glycosylhydrolase [bacterium]|nr:family 10 glycosylhydrolase [bacterium]